MNPLLACSPCAPTLHWRRATSMLTVAGGSARCAPRARSASWRRRAWQERELPVDPHAWSTLSTRAFDPAEELATRERLREVTAAIQTRLSPHQREVLTALVLAEVPIDVLAERLNTTRGALYKTL